VILVRLHFSSSLKEATRLVEQGRKQSDLYITEFNQDVRVGPEVIKDMGFHVTRNMEDFVTWVDSSKIRRHVQKYNEELDDYDLLNP
jgi:U3 small nucleolar ribonucleoprotein protein IMP3